MILAAVYQASFAKGISLSGRLGIGTGLFLKTGLLCMVQAIKRAKVAISCLHFSPSDGVSDRYRGVVGSQGSRL